MARTALVLSGGSIKGAFQAGAAAYILQHGFVPDAIYGTSVGSLNGGFLANRAGCQGARAVWADVGARLESFWRHRITSFRRLGRRRGPIGLALSLAWRWDGVLDMKALREMVHEELDRSAIRKSPAELYTCSVDLSTGEAVYAERGDPDILDHIVASTAIPLLMPVTRIGARYLWDGGIREVAPLRKAVKSGADRIVCIACDPEKTEGWAVAGRKAPFELLAGRLMEIVTNETLNNDIRACLDVNRYLEGSGTPAGLLGTRRRVTLTVIRPERGLNIDLEHFTSGQISELLELGREAAEKAWSQMANG